MRIIASNGAKRIAANSNLDKVFDSIFNKSKTVKTSSIHLARKTQVPLKGVLRQTEDGFVYIKVSNDVIHGIYSLLADEGVEKPPYFDEDGIGAHISVMHESESKGIDIKEIGKDFTFNLGKLYSVEPEGWKGMERVWFVEVEAPQLKELRKKYSLPATYKDKGHNFHITVGVKHGK